MTMSYYTLFQASVALNNTAILHLADGSYSWSKAYDVLKHSLGYLNDSAVIAAESNLPPHAKDDQEHQLLSPVTFDWIDVSSPPAEGFGRHRYHNATSSLLCHLVVKINIGGAAGLNNLAAVVDVSAPSIAAATVHDAKIRWAINYNHAILLHLVASGTGEGLGGNVLLTQAQTYYATSQVTIPLTVPYKDTFRLLLASQNNLSCIYLDLGMHQEHMSGLKVLALLILDLQNKQFNNRNDDVNHQIFLNLMVLSRFHMFAPAA